MILLVLILLFTMVMSVAFPVSVFSSQELDGFYQQIQDVKNSVGGRHELFLVHSLRYAIISPFLFFESFDFGRVVNTVLISNFISFLMFKHWKYVGRVSLFVIILLIVPYLVSLRTSLLVISMFILYLFLLGAIKPRLLFAFGFVLSVLSSGAVLNYLFGLIYMLFFSDKFKLNKKYVLIASLLVVLAITPSLINKLSFFGGGLLGVYNMISRSNVFAAMIYGNYINLSIYLLLTFVFIYFSSYFNKPEKFSLLLCLISLYTLEGLGSLALIPVVLYFCLYRMYFFT